MPLYTRESLETLRRRIDLVDVLEPHIELKKAGASYKALCPFHDEKTPSFTLQKGDSHYHCFGCGAHGDAIEFLMNYLKLPFSDAIEVLAERFQVHLDKMEEGEREKGPKRSSLKEALEAACRLYQFTLLYTEEGKEPLGYLVGRGLSLDFIRRYRLGLAPNIPGYLRKVLHQKGFGDEILETAGLITEKKHDFFRERITFPIHEPTGAVIGFSARKWREETFGGKYVNTAETPLFKKSRLLFGLNYSRRRIAKERQAIIVEGQVDALRLIDAGFDFVVAGQGTAFGLQHVDELLQLGVQKVYLVMDGDEAGAKATAKIGDLFQKRGVEVLIPTLTGGKDPDEFLRAHGADEFQQALDRGVDFLTFLVRFYGREFNLSSPAGKDGLVKRLAEMIQGWDSELMVHEALKKLAHLLNVPEHFTLGLHRGGTPIFVQKGASIKMETINPDRILESDLVRWLFVTKERGRFLDILQKNLTVEDFRDEACRLFIERVLEAKEISRLELAEEPRIQELLHEMSRKIVQVEKAEKLFLETIQKILDRNWMETREEMRRQILSGALSDEEALLKLKAFSDVKRAPEVTV